MPALAGTKTPAVLKSPSKGATIACAKTPVNCPYISGPRAARTAGGWPTKHLPAGRRAGRSDRAERRFRRQSFILLFVGASSIPLVSAESGENSLIPRRLLFPPNPLRWASAGALFSSANRLICLKYAEGASHMAWESPLQRGFKSHSHKRLTFAFAGESGYTRHPSP